MAGDVSRIWSAPTTEHRDRQELIRILIRSIVVEGWATERVGVRIRWMDDAPEQLVDVWLEKGVERLVVEAYRQGTPFVEIADKLNDIGTKTRRGRTWTKEAVQEFVYRRVRREPGLRRACPPAWAVAITDPSLATESADN